MADTIALQIKSLEQRTASVTLSRNASVLELKQEIQLALHVDSERQRLIFQGRVLKDDKHLTDYANLDDGKVVHLVIRPVDAPHNPQNDEPNAGSRSRSSASRSRLFPSISGRFPMMEGYAFITLDSHISDMGSNRSLLPTMLSGFAGRNTDTPSVNNSSSTFNFGTPNRPTTRSSTASFTFGRPETNSNRTTTTLPFPPSVEVRLARTLGSIRNVRNILDEQSNIPQTSSIPHSTPDQLQEIRNRLRSSGNNQSSQIAMVLRELTDVMQLTVPRMREVSTLLREQSRPTTEETNDRNRVQNLSRIVQGMSLINHFLGSVLASADIENMRRANPTSPLTTPVMPTTRLPRGTTTAVRTTTPPPVSRSSPLSNGGGGGESSAKRKNSDQQEESSSSSDNKKPRNEKGKDKDKHV